MDERGRGRARACRRASLPLSLIIPVSLSSPFLLSVANALLAGRVKATAAARAGAAAGYASLATEALAGVRTLYALNLHGPTRDRFGKVENRNGEGERERESREQKK